MQTLSAVPLQRSGHVALLCLALLGTVFAQPVGSAASQPGVSSQSVPSQNAQTAAPDESTPVLKAQLAEMRRSEDRLLATVHWSLGAVVTIAIGLAAFSWWSSSKLHQQDLQRVKDDVHRQLSETVNTQFGAASHTLSEAQRVALDRLQAEMVAHTLGHVSDLRFRSGDILGAIDAAFEQVSAAKIGNTNYEAHALVKLATAFDAALAQGLAINPERVQHARRVAVQSHDPLGKQAQALTDVLSRLPKNGA